VAEGRLWRLDGAMDLTEVPSDDPSVTLFARADALFLAVTVDQIPVGEELAVAAALGQRTRLYRDRPGFLVLGDARIEVPGGDDGRVLTFVGTDDDEGSDPSVYTLVAARAADGSVVTANAVRPKDRDDLAPEAARFVAALRLTGA
jgi:hypothetical protein